ncbi:MAG TPA: tryptophan transporter [Bacillota bacterium]|nr:tryptophan transporter [Bacillota bacterium]
MSANVETRVVEKKGLKAVDLTVAALLIAAGAVIRLTVPPMFGITPNFAIAMYSLAILLIKPKIGPALGIGIVAGLVCMVSSKAAYPVNIVSEPVGALVCVIIFNLFESKFKGFVLTPFITTALATLASGLSFVGVYFVFRLVPVAVAVQMLITVVTLTVLNAIIVQVLYFPAKKLLKKS